MVSFLPDFAAKICDHFLPHSERRAKALRHSALAGYVGLLLSLGLFLRFFPRLAPGVLGFISNFNASDIVSLTNQERGKAGLNELTVDPRLEEAARAKGEGMLKDSYWSHTAPDGTTPWDFILSSGYDYIYAGENLAKDFALPAQAMAAWMASSTHKANIVNPNYKNIGVAVVSGQINGEEVSLVVQMFGTEPVGLSQTKTVPKAVFESKGAALEPIVAGVAQNEKLSVLNSFKVSQEVAGAVIALLMVLLLLDAYAAYRKKLHRLVGHNLAHLLMIGVALIGILGSGSGSIL